MKLPSTRAIAAYLAGITAPVLAWVTTQAHWTTTQTIAVAGAAGATIALAGFVVEHLRKETPSRWVGVFGLVPAEITTVAGLGFAFGWWGVTGTQASTWLTNVALPLLALLGVTVAQGKVTSPETFAAAVRSAHMQGMAATGRKMSDGSSLPGSPQ